MSVACILLFMFARWPPTLRVSVASSRLCMPAQDTLLPHSSGRTLGMGSVLCTLFLYLFGTSVYMGTCTYMKLYRLGTIRVPRYIYWYLYQYKAIPTRYLIYSIGTCGLIACGIRVVLVGPLVVKKSLSSPSWRTGINYLSLHARSGPQVAWTRAARLTW